MFQEIAAFIAFILAILFLIKKFFFKSKKSGDKHCGVSDCDIH